MTITNKPKIIVIVGPTASGKSSLAVNIAQTFDGEVISADSRQLYTGLDIASGKITQEEMQGIPHYLLDVVDPDEQFSVVDFKKMADSAIEDICNRGKVPIVAGGSGFYIQAIVDNFTPPPVEPNEELREKLQKKDTQTLHNILQKMDARRAREIDENNPRRLIRAIEIADQLGKVPRKEDTEPKYNCLQIGLKLSKDELQNRIHTRTEERFAHGMINEVKELHRNGLSYERMEELGLEYELLANYLAGKIETKEELQSKIETADWQYAKKQMSWFKRDERIRWFHPNDEQEITDEVQAFLH